jgi:acetamidase/formamidase
MDASIYGRGAGEGFGVHICTGPIAVKGAEPGDVLEVRILDMVPRPSRNPDLHGRIFGSSVAAWWGYHYDEFLSEPKPREAVTIYEIFTGDEPYAQALYSYRWQPQTDPYGVVHQTYDYPGIPVAAETIRRRHGVLDGIRIPLRPHFGVIGVAPREAGLVDSVPPAYFGGNLDNWRLGKGAAVYLPVSVPQALLSIGDPHAAQGDGELSGTAIECSMTGTFQIVLHKKADFAGRPFADLTYPLIETETDRIQSSELSRRIRRQGTERSLRKIIARSGDEGRVSQSPPISGEYQRLERRRSDRADFGGGGFRRHASGRRQLGCPRRVEQTAFRARRRSLTARAF